MTIQQANQYFAALPDGFADPAQLGALLPASVLPGNRQMPSAPGEQTIF